MGIRLARLVAIGIFCIGMPLLGPAQGPPPRPATPPPTSALAQPATPREEPVEKRFKNIQVFTGLPASQLLPVMHFMRSSLGVRCEFCHTVQGDQFASDDKKEKQTARRMIRMVLEINKNTFDGRIEVTCNTCHRGQSRPVSLTPVGQGAFPDTTHDPEPPVPEALPTAGEVLDRYLEALGGERALRAVHTRTLRGTLFRMRVDNAGTPKATAVNRGDSVPLEIALESPNKFLITLTVPQGKVTQGFDGTSGWLVTPRGKRDLSSAEVARVLSQNDLQFPLQLRDRVGGMKVLGRDVIGGRPVYVLRFPRADSNLEKLFFDTQDGLLLRRIVYTPLPIGLDPEQTDFEDYREVGGVKLPFSVRVSYLDDNHLGTTRRFSDIKDDVPLEGGYLRSAHSVKVTAWGARFCFLAHRAGI